jgi:O-antigen/teichoic acid export membrane protein
MRMTDKLTPSLGRMRSYRVRFETYAGTTGIDEVVTPELPIVDVAQLPTQKLLAQIGIRTTSVLSHSSHPTFKGISIADQPTWILPVIAGPGRAANPVSVSTSQTADSGSYLSLALEMIKTSGIYALGAFASPLISLLLTPFLTHQLSRRDFGALAVLYTIIDLVTIITQLGISPAFFRAYNGDYETPRDRAGVLSVSIILLTLVSIPIAVVIMVAAPWLSEVLFNSPAFSESVRLTALVIILENLTVPGISWLRAEKRAIFYSALSIINVLLILGTNILLVGVLHTGMNGALLAKGMGYAAIVVCTLPIMLLLLLRRKSLHLRSDIMRNMLFFGVPTIFSSIAAWVLQLSDRYLLSHFGSLAQTASYSVAYTLGSVLNPLFLAPFGLAWIPVMYAIAKREEAAHIFRLVFRWYSTILFFATFALSLLSTVVLELFFPPAYQATAIFIPIITLSTMLLGVYYFFAIGVLIRRKTILEFLYLLIAASVNVLLNMYFIPHYGALGAAVSTLLAYMLLVLITYVVNQRIYPVTFEIGLFIIRLLIGVALYVGSSLLAHTQRPLISWSISTATLILYGVFLMLLGGVSIKKLKKIFRYTQVALRKRGKKAYA